MRWRHLGEIIDTHSGHVPEPRHIGLIQAQIRNRAAIQLSMDTADDIYVARIQPAINENRKVDLRDIAYRRPNLSARCIRRRREYFSVLT